MSVHACATILWQGFQFFCSCSCHQQSIWLLLQQLTAILEDYIAATLDLQSTHSFVSIELNVIVQLTVSPAVCKFER